VCACERRVREIDEAPSSMHKAWTRTHATSLRPVCTHRLADLQEAPSSHPKGPTTASWPSSGVSLVNGLRTRKQPMSCNSDVNEQTLVHTQTPTHFTGGGSQTWMKSFGGTSDEFTTRVVADSNGDVYVTGAASPTTGGSSLHFSTMCLSQHNVHALHHISLPTPRY
jgi:hypothetical protein